MPVTLKSQHRENIASLGRLNRLAEKLYKSNPLNKRKIVMDISSDDVQRLLASLNRFSVKYLLVGGMAGVVHGHIRQFILFFSWYLLYGHIPK